MNITNQPGNADLVSPDVESGPARYVQPPADIAEALKRLNTTPEGAWKLAVAATWGFCGDADSPYEYDQGDRLLVEYDDLYDLASIALAALKLLGVEE